MSNINLNFDSIILQCEREVQLFGTDILLEIDKVYEINGYSFSVVALTKSNGNLLIHLADVNSDIQATTTKFNMEFEISRSFSCTHSINVGYNNVIGYDLLSEYFFIPVRANAVTNTMATWLLDGVQHYVGTPITITGTTGICETTTNGTYANAEQFVISSGCTGAVFNERNYSAIDFVNRYRHEFGPMANEE